MNLGIIAEYNPFHNGHLLHITKSKTLTKADNVIAVMSGNFLQRGEPAILDKQKRTYMALNNGIDMVLELPVKYSTGSADIFSFGAIDIINKSGIIDAVSFGSEQGDLELLSDIVDILTNEPEEFKSQLKFYLDKGKSYPVAREFALSEVLKADLSFINSPNNILAIEYLKALKLTDSKVKPYTIQREVNQYNQSQLSGKISSATAIRQAVTDNKLHLALEAIPPNCHRIFSDAVYSHTPNINGYSQALHYILRTSTPEQLSAISDITEGLENRILANCNTFLITDIIDRLKTKRYTYTKLQRALLHILLNIRKSDYQPAGVPYIRVLGFRKDKSNLLSELTSKSSVPVITNVKTHEQLMAKEIMATDLYYMTTTMERNAEYTNPIVIV